MRTGSGEVSLVCFLDEHDLCSSNWGSVVPFRVLGNTVIAFLLYLILSKKKKVTGSSHIIFLYAIVSTRKRVIQFI